MDAVPAILELRALWGEILKSFNFINKCKITNSHSKNEGKIYVIRL